MKDLFCRVISRIVPVLCKLLALQVLVEKSQKISYAEAGVVEDVKDGLRGYGNKQVTDT